MKTLCTGPNFSTGCSRNRSSETSLQFIKDVFPRRIYTSSSREI